ncbi:MAG: hypothetical protein J6U05_01690 [Neisseriaceae bacterium]|nr:hypothetical protein [Neisseriaceae bacterium]
MDILYIKFLLILAAISLFLIAIFEKDTLGDNTWFLFKGLAFLKIFHATVERVVSSIIPIWENPTQSNRASRILCFLLGCVCLLIGLKIG